MGTDRSGKYIPSFSRVLLAASCNYSDEHAHPISITSSSGCRSHLVCRNTYYQLRDRADYSAGRSESIRNKGGRSKGSCQRYSFWRTAVCVVDGIIYCYYVFVPWGRDVASGYAYGVKRMTSVVGKILTEFRSDTLYVTIANETRRNAMTLAMWNDLREAFEKTVVELGAICVVITGSGTEAFCAGADIDEFETVRSNKDQVTQFHEKYVGTTLHAILSCPVPTIACINGKCFGGGLEIAACCDIRLGVDTTLLGAPVARLGFPLALGETEILVRVFGFTVAAELLLEGRVLNAEEAFFRRILTRVASRSELNDELEATVNRISKGSPYANNRMKAQLHRLLIDSSSVSEEERLSYYDFAERSEAWCLRAIH